MNTRIETAVKALEETLDEAGLAYVGMSLLDLSETVGVVATSLAAHDLAHGVHRLTIDDAAVERAAKVLPHDQRCSGLYPCGCWDDRVDTARAVLAAAVQEERA